MEQLELGIQVSEPTFEILLKEVRENMRVIPTIKAAFAHAAERYRIPFGETFEVLHCGIYIKLKGRPRVSSIPYSEKNLAEYVRVLMHYGISFEEAMMMGFTQYHIEDFSEKAQRLFRKIGGILGVRKGSQAA